MIQSINHTTSSARFNLPGNMEKPVIHFSYPEADSNKTNISIPPQTLEAYYLPQKPKVAFNGFFSDKKEIGAIIETISQAKNSGNLKDLHTIDKTEKNQGTEINFKIGQDSYQLEEVNVLEPGLMAMPAAIHDRKTSLTVKTADGNEKIYFITPNQWDRLINIIQGQQ
jgi:hypothetical protein